MFDQHPPCDDTLSVGTADSFQRCLAMLSNSVAPHPTTATTTTTTASTATALPYECYATRDLLTEPPTTVCIVPDAATASAALARAGLGNDTFYVTFADVEPTAGWLSDRNNSTLDICFMHSFGKCFGKAKERNACTCHQIHVKRAVLDNLRRFYKNPQRHYFCRTIKANVSERFAQTLSLFARRRFCIQYLEFKKEDVDVTAGSTAYEVSYRQWLLGDTPPANTCGSQASLAFTDNYISEFNLCCEFSLTGRCPRGASCPDVHGHTEKAHTKDRQVRAALEELKQKKLTMDFCQTGGEAGYTSHIGAVRDRSRRGPVGSEGAYSQPMNYNQTAPLYTHQRALAPVPLPQGNTGFRLMTSTSASVASSLGTQNLHDPTQLWTANGVAPYFAGGGFHATQPTPPYTGGRMTTLLPQPPPPPTPTADQRSTHVGGSPQPFFSQGPLFFISEGNDNVLRLIPVNSYGGYAETPQQSR